MTNLFKKGLAKFFRIRDYFVNPNIKKEDLYQSIRASDTITLLLVILVFHLFYFVFYFVSFPDELLNHAIAFFEILLMVWALFYMKRTSNTVFTSLVLVNFGFLNTMYGLVNYGGIYSVDLLWLTFSTFTGFLFAGRRLGILYACCTFVFALVLYWLNCIEFRDYRSQIASSDGAYEFISFSSVQLLIAFLLFFFVNKIVKMNAQIKALNENQVANLNQMIKAKTIENENIRHQVVKDFHDLMGNKLASIASISQTIQNAENDVNDFVPQIQHINQLSKDVYESTKDFIWTMTVEHNNLFFLYQYLKDFSEKLFLYSPISFLSEPIDEVFETETRSQYQCSQLILMVKEIMTNVLTHSQASKVELLLYREGKNILFEVKDNGIGFDSNQLKRVNGLNNIKERAQQMETNCSVKSQLGIGTSVVITIPNQLI